MADAPVYLDDELASIVSALAAIGARLAAAEASVAAMTTANATLTSQNAQLATDIGTLRQQALVDAATIAAFQAQITLLQAALAAATTVSISGAQSKPEGNSGTTLFTYIVSRTVTTGAVAVPWSFAPGSTSTSDYPGGVYPVGGSVQLADGVATGTITIIVNGDTTVEPDETFTVSITAPAGYAAGSAMSATGTILNDDVAASNVTFDNAVQRVEQTYTFTARRDRTAGAETRTISLAPSSTYLPAATAADLAGIPSQSVTFADGAATAPVSFTVPATVQPE